MRCFHAYVELIPFDFKTYTSKEDITKRHYFQKIRHSPGRIRSLGNYSEMSLQSRKKDCCRCEHAIAKRTSHLKKTIFDLWGVEDCLQQKYSHGVPLESTLHGCV